MNEAKNEQVTYDPKLHMDKYILEVGIKIETLKKKVWKIFL